MARESYAYRRLIRSRSLWGARGGAYRMGGTAGAGIIENLGNLEGVG